MWQFIRASVAGIAGAYRSMPFPEATAFSINAIRGVTELVMTEKATIPAVRSRLVRCHQCPVFNKKLKTCGTPGDVDKWGNNVGCWCFIPLVAKYKQKECWLVSSGDQRAVTYGWIH